MVTPDGTNVAGAVGAVHPRRLRLSARSRPPTPCSRTRAPARAATSPRCSATRRRSTPRRSPRPRRRPAPRPAALAQTDFVGFAVHCAAGLGDSARPARTTCCRHEPGGYTGYKGLFGAQEIDPLLTGQPASVPGHRPARPADHRPVRPARLPRLRRHVGRGLAGVRRPRCRSTAFPVTYAYISDAHDFHGVSGNAHMAYGPGSAGYVAAAQGLRRRVRRVLQPAGGRRHRPSPTRCSCSRSTRAITSSAVTHDRDCDGVTMPCDLDRAGRRDQRQHRHAGRQPVPVRSRRSSWARPRPNAFTVHGDDAPPFYLAEQGARGRPVRARPIR